MVFFLAILAIVLFVVGFVLTYLFASVLFVRIPTNRKWQSSDDGFEVVLVSNGAHTDIVFPIQNSIFDWSTFIDLKDYQPSQAKYIALGWGDKGFYLETPSWAELKPRVAFRALFKLGESAMHVVLYDEIPEDMKWHRTLKVSHREYWRMAKFVRNSFDRGTGGQVKRIEFEDLPCYEHLNHQFYEGEGQYHFFKTCNSWVNSALKYAGIKTATWTPFSKGIFFHHPELEMDLYEDFNFFQTEPEPQLAFLNRSANRVKTRLRGFWEKIK